MRAITHHIRPAALTVAMFLGIGATAHAAEDVPARDWSFDGMFGTYDRASAQRGLQIFTQNCGGCHSLDLLSYRNLAALGYDENEVKAIAAQYQVADGPDEFGDMFQRPALPSDRFVAPFPNEALARLANNGALPPDLSLIAKARPGRADYLAALLTGYVDPPPDGVELMPGMSYNEYFPGNQIAMPQLLYDDGIAYDDGTAATAEQQALDITTFLMWAAEPHMEARKQMGVKVLLFLIVFAGLMYAVKRKVWADLH